MTDDNTEPTEAEARAAIRRIFDPGVSSDPPEPNAQPGNVVPHEGTSPQPPHDDDLRAFAHDLFDH